MGGVSTDGEKGILIFTPDAATEKIQMWDTITCAHCNNVLVVIPGSSRVHNYCPCCDEKLCDKPSCKFNPSVIRGCTPWAKNMEIREERVRIQYTLARGYDSL